MLKAIEEQGRLGEIKVMTGCGDGQAYFKLMDEYKDKIWLSTQTYAPYMMGDLVRLCQGPDRRRDLRADHHHPAGDAGLHQLRRLDGAQRRYRGRALLNS